MRQKELKYANLFSIFLKYGITQKFRIAIEDITGDPQTNLTTINITDLSRYKLVLVSTLNGANGFELDGVAASDRSGFSVATAGDVNGDGIQDIIIGAYGASPGGLTNAGSCYAA